MKYKYTFIHNGQAQNLKHEDKNALMAAVIDFFEKHNIKFDHGSISRAIDRQSKITSSDRSVGLAEAFIGAKALLNYTRGKAASAKEMNRRASICAQCPVIQSTSGCQACGASRQAANLANQIRVHKGSEEPIPKTVSSKYCGICECSLSLMVVTQYKDFNKESEEKNSKRPDNCWLKRTSINFTNE